MRIKKILYILPVLILTVSILFSSCGSDDLDGKSQPGSTVQNNSQVSKGDNTGGNGSSPAQGSSGASGSTTAPQSTKPEIDITSVKPNEAGKIMVVMFHNFVDTYKKGDKKFTTTFNDFRNLLQTLYSSGYRLISLNDYINNKIDVPAGCIPMVFTFDDGTSGQFNLLEENGRLVANRQSAVGIMEEFNRLHPDFGLKGTFFVNLGDLTFSGKGTVADRLKYLIDRGFEIGNHTYTHIYLNKAKSADEIQKEIGGNQKKMYELVPGYMFKFFSLPYGEPAKELQQYVVGGEFEGIKYQNSAIMEVGWDPALSPVSVRFDPLSIHRVRASGIVAVEADLAWWLAELSREEQYVSDGNPDTITVPKSKESVVDAAKLSGKKLIVY
jgi:hypothetical protein